MTNCIIFIGNIDKYNLEHVNKIYSDVGTNIKICWLYSSINCKISDTIKEKYNCIQYKNTDILVYKYSCFYNWAKLPEIYLDCIGKFDKYLVIHYTTKYSGNYNELINKTNSIEYDLITSNYKLYPIKKTNWMWINEYLNNTVLPLDNNITTFTNTYNYLYCISYEGLKFIKEYNKTDIKDGLDELWLGTLLYNYGYKCKSFNDNNIEFNCNLNLCTDKTYGFGVSNTDKSINEYDRNNKGNYIYSGYNPSQKSKNIIIDTYKLDNYKVNLPKLSVIIPISVNLANNIKCLDYCVNQTLKDIEVIIVDENNIGINSLYKYTDIISILYIQKQKNGFADSINAAINNASGKYCVVFNTSVCINDNDIFEKLYNMIENNICDVLYVYNGKDNIFNNITKSNIFDTKFSFNPVLALFDTKIVKNNPIKFEEYFKDYYRKFAYTTINYNMSIKYAYIDNISIMNKYIDNVETSKVLKLNNNSNDNAELTCIITFRNENVEVEKTVQSIRATANNVKILLVNDNSEDNFDYERIANIYNCKYLCHNTAIGCGPSRDDGVANCTTKYFILLDSHMRFYEMNWDVRLVNLIKECPNSIICSQTGVINKDKDGYYKNEDNLGNKSTSLGSVFVTDYSKLFDVKWCSEQIDKQDTGNLIKIYCVLGAGYCSSVEHWNNIYGLQGLYNYGLDEGLMSFKTWAVGGTCYLLKDFVIGHIYRDSSPFTNTTGILESNRLMCFDLFLNEDTKSICNKKLKERIGSSVYSDAEHYYSKERKQKTLELRKKLLPKFIRSLDEFIKVNEVYYNKLI